MRRIPDISILTTLISIGSSVMVAAAGRADEQSKPNIVFFMTDDYGWQDTSEPFWKERSALNERFRTPNMERLADMGVKFTTAYAAGSVCSPSRISIITGQNPVRHGSTFVVGTDGVDTETMRSAINDKDGVQKEDIVLPTLLKEAGYRTMCVGKAHFGDRGTFGADPANLGFERNHYAGANGGPIGKWLGGIDDYHVPREGQQVHYSEALTLEAKAEISEAVNDRKPFFLYLSHYAPHTPMLVDERFSQNYPDLKGRDLAYATLVEGADKSLGDVLDHLKELGIEKNTLIIWTSDNGSCWGNKPLRGYKSDAYEGGVRVPTMVAWGAQDASLVYQKRMPLTPGRVDDRPFIHQDWMPTLLSFVGAKHPNPELLDGYDITDLLSGKSQNVRPDLFFWHGPNFWLPSGPESSVREGKWKLIYFYATEKWELYDLSEDIGEMSDLSGTYPEKVQTLAKKLIDHLKENNARYPIDVKSGNELPPQLP